MAEHRIVVPVVGGSSPLIHPVERFKRGAQHGKGGATGRGQKLRPPLERPGAARRPAPRAINGCSLPRDAGKGTPTSGRHRGPQGRRRLMAARSREPPARERRPPVGTAPRSGAKPRTADREESRGRPGNADLRSAPRRAASQAVSGCSLSRATGKGTPTSGRHRGPQGRGGRDPNRRDGSLLGAFPSRAGWRATAGPHRENWPPVSDRHRAGARNLR